MKNLALILTVFIFLGCNNDPQSENQNISKAKKGTLYFGTDGISGVYQYYYLLSNGKVMYGCPTGGLETFDVNSFWNPTLKNAEPIENQEKQLLSVGVMAAKKNVNYNPMAD